jgi:sucrose phosphorylase
LVNWKNNPDGTRSPYEINVTYLDALSSQDSPDDERIARFILAHAVLLSFPGVPAVYIQSILGSRNDYEGVERLGYNRAINRKKYTAGQIDLELKIKKHSPSNLFPFKRVNCYSSWGKAFHPDVRQCLNHLMNSFKIVRVADNGERITALFNFSHNVQTVYEKFFPVWN